MEKIIKYIDCDGVILDTETGLFDEYHRLKNQDPRVTRLAYLQQLNWQEWIRQAKVIGDAIEILKSQDPINVQILTKVHSLAEGLAKIEYFREMGIQNNIVLVPNDLKKSSVVQAAGHLLVDDSTRNLDDWSLQGGVSILFDQFGEKREDSSYSLVYSLESVFSPETDEYCKKMLLKR